MAKKPSPELTQTIADARKYEALDQFSFAGIYYKSGGEQAAEEGLPDLAQEYMEKALEVYQKAEDPLAMSQCLQALADWEEGEKKWDLLFQATREIGYHRVNNYAERGDEVYDVLGDLNSHHQTLEDALEELFQLSANDTQQRAVVSLSQKVTTELGKFYQQEMKGIGSGLSRDGKGFGTGEKRRYNNLHKYIKERYRLQSTAIDELILLAENKSYSISKAASRSLLGKGKDLLSQWEVVEEVLFKFEYKAELITLFQEMGAKGMSHLVRLLDGEEDQQELAKEILPNLGETAVKSLEEIIADPSDFMAGYAVEALSRIEPLQKSTIDKIVKLLDSKDEDILQEAIYAIERIGEPAKAAIPRLIKLLKGDHKDEAAGALGSLGTEATKAAPLLIDLLDAADEFGDSYVQRGLTGMGKGAVDDLCQAARDPKKPLKPILEIFQGMGKEAQEAIPLLLELLEENRQTTDVIHTLSKIGQEPDRVIPAIIQVLKNAPETPAEEELEESEEDNDDWYNDYADDPFFLKCACFDALAEFGSKATSAFPTLLKWAKSKDEYDRKYAVETLGKIPTNDATVIDALVQAVGDEDHEVNYAAKDALRFQGASAMPAIVKALESKDRNLVSELLRCLTNMKGEEVAQATEPLLKLLHHKDQYVRLLAVRNFGVMGSLARDHRDTIAAMSKDKDREVKDEVKEALKLIDLD